MTFQLDTAVVYQNGNGRMLHIARSKTKEKIETLIQFYGMRRTGNHALIYWLLGHKEEDCKFFNNCRPFGSNIYLPLQDCPSLVVVGFENIPIATMHDSDQHAYGIAYNANNIYKILLLRDLFNWMPRFIISNVGFFNGNDIHDKLQHKLNSWENYANEFAGNTTYMCNKICVSYNEWFLYKQYRQLLSSQLGLSFTDKWLNYVSNHCGGSGFDQRKYHGIAQKMPVMDRWKQTKNSDELNSLYEKHPTCLKLCLKLFGHTFSDDLLKYAETLIK